MSALSPEAWQALLARLGDTETSQAEHYETLRRKLVKFFDWRQAPEPESLADQVLDRVARKLAEGEQVEEVSAYAYAVARLIYLEDARRGVRSRERLNELPPPVTMPAADDGGDDATAMAAYLARCLRNLPPETRQMIVAYYQDDKSAKIERRKALAEQLGIPMNALRIRACRVRAELEKCVNSRREQESR
ncbi:MAG: sigma-70 family RNA polymerase sigma factor [Bryobacterales bacterium]|nr:sigma-70 family RNA polymerase sigma factor [Bryobacterales bacterium]